MWCADSASTLGPKTNKGIFQPEKRVEELILDVAKTFMPNDKNESKRVLPCATRRGIGARVLLQNSEHKKPDLSVILEEESLSRDVRKNFISTRAVYAIYLHDFTSNSVCEGNTGHKQKSGSEEVQSDVRGAMEQCIAEPT